MEDNIIRLLIADDDEDMCKILQTYFEMQPFIEVCGIAYDGEQAVNLIRSLKPDVAIVDIVMPERDGICVLEDLKAEPPEKRPFILVTSASGQEIVMRKAYTLGADFFIMKPYSLDVLLSRVLMVAEIDTNVKGEVRDIYIENRIAKAVLMLGIPTQLLGYQYINYALYYLIINPKPCSISKMIYETIAKKYGTTSDCVERAIRQALQKAFENNTELMRKILMFGNMESNKRPSNGRFLTLVATYIKLEGKL